MPSRGVCGGGGVFMSRQHELGSECMVHTQSATPDRELYHSECRDMGVAQNRYCTYVERALYAQVPRPVRLVLTRVVLDGLEGLRRLWAGETLQGPQQSGSPKSVSLSAVSY